VSAAQSPHIERLQWGTVTLAGGQRFKDVKLFPGGARAWDWGETGTRHSPGIQLADVQELLDHGAEVVVLSQGQIGRLKVAAETVRALEELGVEVHVLPTRQAVESYNRLREDSAVGALIHSTC
jgi:hypothetical protein